MLPFTVVSKPHNFLADSGIERKQLCITVINSFLHQRRKYHSDKEWARFREEGIRDLADANQRESAINRRAGRNGINSLLIYPETVAVNA